MGTLLLAAARGAHFAAMTLAFGVLAFALAVARPAFRADEPGERFRARAIEGRLIAVALAAALVSLASAAGWLVAQTAAIGGVPLADAFDRPLLASVLAQTLFGRVWLVRAALLIALALLLAVALGSGIRRSLALTAAAVAAAAALGTLAWAGHAAAAEGGAAMVQLGSDVVHLLAAGGWLGALLGLVLLLRATNGRVAAAATRRFSTLGIVSVAALIATGIVNAWYLVGGVPALLGTTYGRLLALKLALFALMLALAAANRLRLAPQVGQGRESAVRHLRRNAIVELAAGTGVLAIVAVLGITVPAVHETVVWPFDRTLEFDVEDSQRAALWIALAAAAGCVGAGVAFANRRRRPAVALAGVATTAGAAVAGLALFAVPAYPTTYMAPSVPYDVPTISRGADVYARHCVACHGSRGAGDGPLAQSLAVAPANLATHARHHRPGDLFWWVAHGLPGTPMPPFSPQLGDNDVWRVVRFLEFRADAVDAEKLTGSIDPRWGIVAPDFTFERAGGPQQSLRATARGTATLLVLYSLPDSAPRLDALAAADRSLGDAGLRIVALPMDAAKAGIGAAGKLPFSVAASPDAARLYAMLTSSDPLRPVRHAEFLVDGQGYLRARWRGPLPDGEGGIAEVRTAVDELHRAPPLPPPRPGHH
jgi:putative copper export protein/mono/diheme cytochrome c family protein